MMLIWRLEMAEYLLGCNLSIINTLCIIISLVIEHMFYNHGPYLTKHCYDVPAFICMAPRLSFDFPFHSI